MNPCRHRQKTEFNRVRSRSGEKPDRTRSRRRRIRDNTLRRRRTAVDNGRCRRSDRILDRADVGRHELRIAFGLRLRRSCRDGDRDDERSRRGGAGRLGRTRMPKLASPPRANACHPNIRNAHRRSELGKQCKRREAYIQAPRLRTVRTIRAPRHAAPHHRPLFERSHDEHGPRIARMHRAVPGRILTERCVGVPRRAQNRHMPVVRRSTHARAACAGRSAP